MSVMCLVCVLFHGSPYHSFSIYEMFFLSCFIHDVHHYSMCANLPHNIILFSDPKYKYLDRCENWNPVGIRPLPV